MYPSVWVLGPAGEDTTAAGAARRGAQPALGFPALSCFAIMMFGRRAPPLSMPASCAVCHVSPNPTLGLSSSPSDLLKKSEARVSSYFDPIDLLPLHDAGASRLLISARGSVATVSPWIAPVWEQFASDAALIDGLAPRHAKGAESRRDITQGYRLPERG